MTADPFTTAALAEARRAWEGDECMMMPDLAVHMAEWARDHLAAQGPTDAERTAATGLAATHRAIAVQARADGDPGRAHLHDWAATQADLYTEEQNHG